MSDITVNIDSTNITVELAVGAQGEPGPSGPPGGSSVTYTAGEALAAARVVIIEGGEAFLFQPSNAAHQGRAYGITIAAATIGADAEIQIAGEIENAAFTFAADSILFVYNNGIIVDTPPVSTIVQQAGVSSGSDKMLINFATSILK